VYFSAIVPILATPLAAQEMFDGERVNAIAFNGASKISQSELRDAIVTEARRCKSILFQPFCLISNSGTFEAKPRLDALELERDELRLRVHYWRAGYRATQASARVQSDGDGVRVTFDIEEGPPTVLASVDVEQTDSVLSSTEIGRAKPPQAGMSLDLSQVDSTRILLQSMLWDLGYADASVRDSIVVTDTIARLLLEIDPGARTTVGELVIDGNNDVSARTIRRLVDLSPGQIFRRRDLIDAQRRLYRSELFRQTLLQVEATQDSVKPLELTVREAPFRAIRLSAGFNTVDFVQTEARYTIYNWLGSARRVDLRATVGNLLAPQLYGRTIFGSAAPFGIGNEVENAFLQPTWQVSAEASQPWFFSPRNSVSVGIFANRRSVPGIVVDRGYGSSLTLTRRLSERTPISLTYRYERTRVDAGDLYFCVNFGVCQATLIDALSADHSLSPLWLVARTDRTDDVIYPTRGWTARVEAEHASGITASDFRYNRLSADLAYHWSVGPGILATHVRAGWIRESSGSAAAIGVPDVTGELLHPRKRFYAGGSRSVRGYAENQLGPRILTIDPDLLIASDTTAAGCTVETIESGACDPNVANAEDFQPRPLGGTSVIEGSLEYRLPVTPNLVAAFFVDAARVAAAGNDTGAANLSAVTPGLGVRYRSPIGPVRIDLGVRPRLTEDLPVVTQVETEDGQLQLVRLNQTMRYDPIGSSGGFFHRLFSRLQLHLSIGEAF
jgi:outer membrane protein insertion porin family/translocation and assembly module TamA